MQVIDIYIAQLQNAHDHFVKTLDGLNAEQLKYRPSSNMHGIGFAVWHALRAWDDYYALITQTQSVYEQENWQEKFGFDSRGKGLNDIGTGFSVEYIQGLNWQAETLNAFLESLWTHTRDDLKTMNDDVLLRFATVPWWNPSAVTFARVLSHIIAHTYVHIGEAEYVRGLLGE